MRKTVRQSARDREPLDGADAQALEGALAMTERELAMAEERNRELTRERDELARRIAAQSELILDAEERGAYWTLKAGARVALPVIGDECYWDVAQIVCEDARDAKGEG